ncbi:hypothetical protein GW17_00059076, partial [Ensete ventricosum]
ARDVVGLLRHRLLGGPCHTPVRNPSPECICGGVWQGSLPFRLHLTGSVSSTSALASILWTTRPAMPTPVAGLKATPKLKPSQQWAIEETGGKLGTMV